MFSLKSFIFYLFVHFLFIVEKEKKVRVLWKKVRTLWKKWEFCEKKVRVLWKFSEGNDIFSVSFLEGIWYGM